MYIKLRIHILKSSHPDTTLEELPSLFSPYVTNEYIYSEETRDKSGKIVPRHFHGIISVVESELKFLRNFLSAYFGKGNAIWSISKILEDELPIEPVSYLMKWDTYIHKLNPELIEQCKKHNEKYVKIKVDKKKTVYSALDEIIKEQSEKLKEHLTVDDIIDSVVKYYKDSERLVREFQLISYVQTFSLKYIPRYYRELSSRIKERVVQKD